MEHPRRVQLVSSRL